MRARSFTSRHTGLASDIQTGCQICMAFNPEKSAQPMKIGSYRALWDTGATRSSITKRVVDELGLKPIGYTEISHVQGVSMVPQYLVNLMLPNNVGFVGVEVSEVILGNNVDVLIGMDIISQGDFSMTNVDGKSVFSFRIPSVKTIDYTAESEELDKYIKIHETWIKRGNDKCPCGSGKKWKNCHGLLC